MTSNVKFSYVRICLVTALALSLIASIGFVGLSPTSAAQQKNMSYLQPWLMTKVIPQGY
jgi:hypothetical protein